MPWKGVGEANGAFGMPGRSRRGGGKHSECFSGRRGERQLSSNASDDGFGSVRGIPNAPTDAFFGSQSIRNARTENFLSARAFGMPSASKRTFREAFGM